MSKFLIGKLMLYCNTSVALLILVFKTQLLPLSTPKCSLLLHSKASKLYQQDFFVDCRTIPPCQWTEKNTSVGCHCWGRRELTRISCIQCHLRHLSVEEVVRWGYRPFSFYLMPHRYVPDAVMLVRKDASKDHSFPIIYIERNSSAHWPFISFKWPR